MVKAIIRGELLTYDQGSWIGASACLADQLTVPTEDGRQIPAGSDPTPELTIAQYVVSELGGKVLSYSAEPDNTVGRIY